MNKIDFSCPKCGCESTSRCSLGMFDGLGTGHYVWWGISLVLIVITRGAFLVMFVVLEFVSLWFRSQTNKRDAKGKWVMKCSRCGTRFMVDNPDPTDWSQDSVVDKVFDYNKHYMMATDSNTVLLDGENMVAGFGLSVFKPSNAAMPYALTVTDRALLLANAEECIRIPKSEITEIKFKYGLGLPGLTVKSHSKTWRFQAYGIIGAGMERRRQYMELLPSWLKSSAVAMMPQGPCSVRLVGVPPEKKIEVIKAIRESSGLSLLEAKNMSEHLGTIIVSSISEEAANGIVAALRNAGADAVVEGVPSSFPSVSDSEERAP